MAGTKRYPGRYFDGETARARIIVACPRPDGIAIEADTGSLVAIWAADRVVYVDPPADDTPLRLGLRGTTARLVVDDHGLAIDLEAMRPEVLHAARAGWRSAVKVAICSVVVVGALAVLFLFLFPFLSEHLARRVPESTKQNIGRNVLERIVEILPRLPGERGPVRYCRRPAGLEPLRRLTERLRNGLEDRLALQVLVIDAQLINAFALPGGYVVLTGGLLRALQSPEELAGILAHEIGHVAHDHSVQAIFRTTAVSLLISVILGDFTGGTVVTAITEWGLNGAYSRAAEREADRFAVELLNRTDMDGRGLGRFLARIQAESEHGADSAIFRMLSTHPPTAARIAFMRERMQGTEKAMMELDWARLQDVCDDVGSFPAGTPIEPGQETAADD